MSIHIDRSLIVHITINHSAPSDFYRPPGSYDDATGTSRSSPRSRYQDTERSSDDISPPHSQVVSGDLDIESQLHNLPPEILRQILISLLRGPENNASGQAGNPVASTAGLANIDEPDQNANPNLIGISSPNGGTLSIAEPDSTTNVERVQVLDNTREVSNSINQASRSASGTERPIFLDLGPGSLDNSSTLESAADPAVGQLAIIYDKKPRNHLRSLWGALKRRCLAIGLKA